jgi:hypothetical protein
MQVYMCTCHVACMHLYTCHACDMQAMCLSACMVQMRVCGERKGFSVSDLVCGCYARLCSRVTCKPFTQIASARADMIFEG